MYLGKSATDTVFRRFSATMKLHSLAGRNKISLPTGLAWLLRTLITVTPDVLGGTPVFRGTRVSVQTLIEYLEGGETIDEFLDGFPMVTREQAIAFLEENKVEGGYVRR